MSDLVRALRNLLGNLLVLAGVSVMTEDRQDEWYDHIVRLSAKP